MNTRSDTGETRAWPDGNTSLLRLALSKLIPPAFPDVDVGDGPARPDQLSILKTDCRYDRLDHHSNQVRVRLNATVFNVKPCKRRGYSPVDYVLNPVPGYGRQARKHKPGAGGSTPSTWSWPAGTGLRPTSWTGSRDLVRGLCYARKVPLIYGRAGLSNWQAFADSKVSNVSPRGTSLFWDSFSVSAGAGFGPSATPGKYDGPTPNQPPSAPAQLSFTVVPNHPQAVPQLFAYSTGQQMLRELSWRTWRTRSSTSSTAPSTRRAATSTRRGTSTTGRSTAGTTATRTS